MRPALKSIDEINGGAALEIGFADQLVLLDPAGIAYFPEMGMLVVSDLHLEKASSFARKRIFLPPYDTAATLARLAVRLQRTLWRS